MIGSKKLARIAESLNYDSRAPNGWKTVGWGGYRRALLAPDGVVYKVMHDPSKDATGHTVNQLEAERSRTMRRKARYLWKYDIAVPEVTAYAVNGTTVNAMPYLPSTRQCQCNSWEYDQDDDGEWRYTYKINLCRCRKWGNARTCFGIVYKVLEEEFGLTDMWAPNLSYNSGFTWPIDLGE